MAKRCKNYVGVTCVDGTCPRANAEEREERDISLITSCRYCPFYRGCEDCALARTKYCSVRI